MKLYQRILVGISAGLALLSLAGTVQAGTTFYRNTVLADSPIVYYEFDETGGTAADNIGSGGAANDGTVVGIVTLGQGSFSQGGVAYDFGGGRVTAAAFSTQTEWTVEAWINWDSAKASGSHIFGNDYGGWNDDVQFGIGVETGGAGVPASNVGCIQQGAPGSTRDFVTQPLSHSVWHHVVATGSDTAGELRLYVDGVLVDTDSSLVNDATMNGHQFAVGAARFVDDIGTRPFDGLIDEFALYGTVLSATTITNHYQAGTASPAVALSNTTVSQGAAVGTLVGTLSDPSGFATSFVLTNAPAGGSAGDNGKFQITDGTNLLTTAAMSQYENEISIAAILNGVALVTNSFVVTLADTSAGNWSPAVISTNLAAWFDASDASTITTNPSGFVSAWNDKSGQDRHATQGTLGNRPAYTGAELNGKNVVTFDGADDWMRTTSFSQSRPVSYVFVCKANGNGPGRNYVFDSASGNVDRNLVALRNGTTVQLFSGAWLDSGVPMTLDPFLITATLDGTSSLTVDDTTVTGDAGSHTIVNGLTLGANSTAGAPTADFLEGYIAELVMIPAASADDLERTEGYLAWKWGLVGNLPDGHAYGASAPTVAADVQLSNSTVASNAPPGTLVGALSDPSGAATSFVLTNAPAGGSAADNSKFEITNGNELRTAVWMTKSSNDVSIAAVSNGVGLVTNSFAITVTAVGAPVFLVSAEVSDPPTGAAVVGTMKTVNDDATFTIVSGRTDLFNKDGSDNLLVANAASWGGVGTTHYVTVRATTAGGTSDLTIAVEVISGTASGTLFSFR